MKLSSEFQFFFESYPYYMIPLQENTQKCVCDSKCNSNIKLLNEKIQKIMIELSNQNNKIKNLNDTIESLSGSSNKGSNSGSNTQESGTGSSTNNTTTSYFDIKLNDVSQKLGNGTESNEVFSVFKSGIESGDLLLKNEISIVFTNTDGSGNKVTITSIDEPVTIENGTYNVTGYIGKHTIRYYNGDNDNSELCALKLNDTVTISGDEIITLNAYLNDILIVSESNTDFKYHFQHEANTGRYSGDDVQSFTYNNYPYLFAYHTSQYYTSYGQVYDRYITIGSNTFEYPNMDANEYYYFNVN